MELSNFLRNGDFNKALVQQGLVDGVQLVLDEVETLALPETEESELPNY
jgi:hypothetical protein